MPRILSQKLLPALTLGLLALAGFVSSAWASAPPDVRGSYTGYACIGGTLAECEANPSFPQIVNLETEDFTTGALTGKGETLSHEPAYTITGAITGCTVSLHTVQPGYTSESTQTLSADGKKLSGTFSDSFGRSNQPTFATRGSGQGCGESEGERVAKEHEAEKVAKELKEKAKHPTGTQVICNYEFATFQNTCVAAVGDGAATPTTPAGTVTFTTTSGGFASGAQCALQASATSPSEATCMLVYQTANSGLPSITATYAGDATHAGSVGRTQYLGGGGPEETTGEGAAAAPGQYPNEVVLETTLPAAATSVEAAVQALSHKLAGEALTLPAIPAGLDPQSATELSMLGSIIKDVSEAVGDVTKQSPILDSDIQKVLDRVGELMQSPSPANQAEAQILQKQAAEVIGRLSKILKKQNEAEQEVIKNARGSAFGAANHKKATRRRTRRVKSLAYVVTRNESAGKLRLRLHLNRAALAKLAGKHSRVTVLLRVTVHLASPLSSAGETRLIVKRITLKRTPRTHGKKKH